jgi:rare lipoprotein A
VFLLLVLISIAGCGTVQTVGMMQEREPAPPAKGAYYKDDGPGANPPAHLASIPDAVPREEPLHRFANRPYQALGRTYTPLTALADFRQRGTGSWYGRRYHGSKTSSGEVYDMYAMSAAHPTLPIPSYARVTNLANGKSVVVRINDRGPFLHDRIIDLSYAAAWKLGYVDAGSAMVEVQSIVPGLLGKAIVLQLGAFSSREAAESFRARAALQLAWLTDEISLVGAGSLYRLQLGPYATPSAARAVADRIQAELDLKPVLVER